MENGINYGIIKVDDSDDGHSLEFEINESNDFNGISTETKQRWDPSFYTEKRGAEEIVCAGEVLEEAQTSWKSKRRGKKEKVDLDDRETTKDQS